MIRFLPEEPIRRHAELCNVGDRLQLEVREAVDDALARAGARLTDQKKERKKKRKTGKKASGASSPRMAAQSSHSGTLGLPAWPQLLFEKFTILILESSSIECFFHHFSPTSSLRRAISACKGAIASAIAFCTHS